MVVLFINLFLLPTLLKINGEFPAAFHIKKKGTRTEEEEEILNLVTGGKLEFGNGR